jgi:hypothetical protein
MKKLFMVVLFTAVFLSGLSCIYCQEALNKGVFSLAGTIDYSSSSYNGNYSSENSHIFTFAPQFVYFVGNHVSLGFTLNYINDFEGSTYSSLSLGPSFRYYFYVKEFIPFLEVSAALGYPNLASIAGLNAGFTIKGGLDCFLSNSVALEPSISYNHSSITPSDNNYPATIANVFEIGIGINYFIFKEK